MGTNDYLGSAPRPIASGSDSNRLHAVDQTHTASVLSRVKEYWKRKGAAATARAVVRTLICFVIRHRCRLVFEASLAIPREPSTWGPSETFLVFGPENIHELSPELLANMDPERHWWDLQSVRDGNRLFVVSCGNYCVHRAYVCTVDRPGLSHDRRAMFFGELSAAPMIRGSETTRYAADKAIYRHVRKGLYSRVLNEQLRYLQAAGYRSAVLFIMAENTLSIKGVTAAGFHLCRVLNDWVFFRSILLQKVCEKGTRTWRLMWH
jgi:hypothetical protein